MFSHSASNTETDIGTLRHDERQREIIVAAQKLIAERGVEGLRIRDVADSVGINNATLHYYFKTKEILIEAVVNQIVYKLVSTYDPQRSQTLNTPVDELEAHLRDILFQMRQTPARFVVLSELLMRSLHEPAIYAILKKTDDNWHAFLVDILRRGIETGVFKPHLDASMMSSMIMMLLKGFNLQLNASTDDLELVLVQVRHWVMV